MWLFWKAIQPDALRLPDAMHCPPSALKQTTVGLASSKATLRAWCSAPSSSLAAAAAVALLRVRVNEGAADTVVIATIASTTRSSVSVMPSAREL